MSLHRNFRTGVILGMLLVLSVSCKKDYVTVTFDSGYEVAGQKIALSAISPGLPSDWDDFEYVVLEYMITTPQRFQVGFTTEDGYNELRVMSYTANGWNRLAIPLAYYRRAPAARSDMAATYNQPRYTGWINLTGSRTDLKGVDSIGIRMNCPIGNPVLKLRSVSLYKDDPGDQYLGKVPVVDEFGQFNLAEWEGKVHSLAELYADWKAEDELPGEDTIYHYSKYGGYLAERVDTGTGFFRTERIDSIWWFVDPEGYLFLSHGVDCVRPGGGGNVVRLEQRRNLYKELPPRDTAHRYGRYRSPSFGKWNLERRYGDEADKRGIENIFTRMHRWGLNTVANWSDERVYDHDRIPFTLQLQNLGIEGRLMGLADVYAPDFGAMVDSSVWETVAPYRENPWLLGYFIFNEPSFQGREQQLCDLILEGKESPIKAALQDHLSSGDTPEKRITFIHETFRIFIETVDNAMEKHDPNHLSLGIRFGGEADDALLEISKDIFDVFSFNCYDLYPRKQMLDRFMEITGKPMLIGEFHFGTVDRGMAQALWQVNSQEERGTAYRYYMEQGYTHPGLIGTAYFQWCDQDLTGRRLDGENYNCGLVDVTDRPYPYLVSAVSETAKRLYDIHSGCVSPTDKAPVGARGHHGIPDLWNQ